MIRVEKRSATTSEVLNEYALINIQMRVNERNTWYNEEWACN